MYAWKTIFFYCISKEFGYCKRYITETKVQNARSLWPLESSLDTFICPADIHHLFS